MRRWIIPCVLLGACGGESRPSGELAVTVTRYDFTFDLESRVAEVAVHMTVTGAGDCVTLPLRADLVSLGGDFSSATVGGESLQACGDGWKVGEEIELDTTVNVPLETWEGSQVGYSLTPDANAATFYYLVSWVGGCDRFAPCDHAPDRFAHYHFTVTHPDDTTVLCPGVVSAGVTETTCTFDLDGGPTYSTFGIVASNGWEEVDKGPFHIYNRVGSTVPDSIDETWQDGFLAFMEDRFGPYPYDDLRLVTGPTYWSGFEHPGNIVLDDLVDSPPPLSRTYSDPANHVLSHELAHQWAGDQTTLADTYDFVWKESMAEYLTFVYEDTIDPTFAARTADLWKGWSAAALFYPVPEDSPRPTLLAYYGDVYGAGPMVLFRQLEALFTRDQVLDALAQLLGTPHAISVDQVQAALEDTTGAELDGYFDAWVRGAGAPEWPVFTIATADAGAGALDVTVTQTGSFGCAFDVALHGGGGEVLDVHFDLGVDGAATATETVTPGFTVTSTELDPHDTCLAFPANALRRPRALDWSPWRSLVQRVE